MDLISNFFQPLSWYDKATEKIWTPLRNIISKQSITTGFTGPLTMYTEDEIASFSDTELFSALKDIGAEVGPIVASTRRVYEKRLMQLQQSPVVMASPLASVSDNSEADDYDMEDEDHASLMPPVQAPVAHPQPMVASLTSGEFANFNVNNRNLTRSQGDSSLVSGSSLMAGLRTRKTYTSSTKTYTSTKPLARKPIHDRTGNFADGQVATTSASSTAATKKRLIPLWIQVAIFFFIAFLIFLIVQNMEPAFRSPFQNTASVAEP